MSERISGQPGDRRVGWLVVGTFLLAMAATVAGTRLTGAGEPAVTAKPAPASTDAAKVSVKVASWKEVQSRVAAHKGSVVVIDAWSTSCPPCLKELPNFVALHKKYQATGLRCISFNCDYDNPSQKPEQAREPVLKFLTKLGATCENVLSSDPLEDWLKAVDLASIPAVYVYGRDGKLAKRFDNDTLKPGEAEFSYAQVTQLVEKLLKEPVSKP